MAKEGLDVKISGVSRFICKFNETGSIARRSGSGRPSNITPQVLTIVERQMQLDDETTAVQLQKLLVDSGHPLSLKTILASHRKLGWTFRGSAYCQLIREANKIKRLEWAKANVSMALSNGFKDVFYTDESSIQLECHRRFACRKKGTQARIKPRAKPPKTTDFAIVYAPTEGLFAELSSYRDPKTKELLLQELMTKHKVTVAGPNTLSALLQSYHLGFQTLKVQKNATQIYGDLRNITTRFEKHFLGITVLRKKLDEAMKATDLFGRDGRSIMRTLENIKDPNSSDNNDKVSNSTKKFNR